MCSALEDSRDSFGNGRSHETESKVSAELNELQMRLAVRGTRHGSMRFGSGDHRDRNASRRDEHREQLAASGAH